MKLNQVHKPSCTNLMLAGANIKDVKEMIGHREIKMTTHLTDAKKIALQEKLAHHYSGVNPGEESEKHLWEGTQGNT